jgi:hypothetical protein
VTYPSGDPQLFNFTLTGGPSSLDERFQLADLTTPFEVEVLPGSGYAAAEVSVPVGWDLTDYYCDDDSPVDNIDVSPGEEVTCTFENTKRATKSGLKWRDYNFNGVRDEYMPGVIEPFITGWYVQLWTYDIVSEAPVSFVGREMTDEFGVYTFENILPNQDYIVCEELPEFWSETFPTLATTPPDEGEGVATCPAVGDGGFPLGPVGWTFYADPGVEFLNNDFGNQRFEGCTRTQGYWKTHSDYGPAPYDDTWAIIGEDTQFFNNFFDYDVDPPIDEISWYEIMWMPPKGGNAYIILAHQYVAAKLNFLSGANPTAVLTEFGQATTLLSTYTWDYDWKADPDGVRADFIALATILDEYNNGYIGPGHCED